MKELLPVLACPDCRAGLEQLEQGLRCGCGCEFPIVGGIPRLLPRALRERLGVDGDRVPAPEEVLVAEEDEALRVSLANVTYHANEPEAYGEEPLASVGMFDPEGNAQRRLAEVIGRLAKDGGDLLIDVGCGPGNVLRHASGRFRRAVGVDLTLPMLERARRDRLSVVAGDAYHLPFASGSADAVTAFSFLHHLSDRSAFLREAARVLRPGGWFYSDWDPNGATRSRSALFRAARDRLVATLDRAGLARRPRYYRSEVRPVAELAEYGWHLGAPLDGHSLAAELRGLGFSAPRVVFHDDCASLDSPREQTALKRLQRALTLALGGQLGLLLRGHEARAEYFLLLARRT